MPRQGEYVKIADRLRTQIAAGEFGSDGPLPTERNLAAALGYSRVTIRSALGELQRDGLISRRQGSGTFVKHGTPPGQQFDRNSVCLIYEEMRGQSFTENPYILMLLDGLGRAALRFGFKIVVLPVPATTTLQELGTATPGLLPESKCVIVSDSHNLYGSVTWLAERGHAVVTLGPLPPGQQRHANIDIDNKAGGRTAARHLLSLGRRRIAFISGPLRNAVVLDRIAGIKKAFEEQVLTYDESLVCIGRPWSEEDGRKAVAALLAFRGARIDALIVQGDLAALGAMRALSDAGVRIPEDVALLVYGDFPWLHKASPIRLTCVRQPFDEMAEEAAEMLMEMRDRSDAPLSLKILQPTLEIRASCGVGLAGKSAAAPASPRNKLNRSRRPHL